MEGTEDAIPVRKDAWPWCFMTPEDQEPLIMDAELDMSQS